MQYKDGKYVVKTLRYRLKTSTRLTKYFNDMYSEGHIWLNAGIQARLAGLSVFDTYKIATLLSTIPRAWVRGAIVAGYEMGGCTHVKYGRKTYPIFSNKPLGKKSKGSIVYFPKCDKPFKLQKGILPPQSQSYKIVDVTNSADKERQFELHITIRQHVPERVATGVHAGVDMGGKHTLIVAKSDNTIGMLTLREKDKLRNIARIQKKMARCKLHSHKWRTLHAQLKSIYKKMGNKQRDRMRWFSKKLMKQCDRIIMEGMNLKTMTTRGEGQKAKNRMMRQSKCGEARNHIAQNSLKHNVEYVEINPCGTSKQCCICGRENTWRKSSQFRCYDCDVLMHADVNAAFNILYTFYKKVQWSKRAETAYDLYYNKAGMVLRGKIHLDPCTIPPSVNDVMAGTGCPKGGRKNPNQQRTSNGAPLNGRLPPTFVVDESQMAGCDYGKRRLLHSPTANNTSICTIISMPYQYDKSFRDGRCGCAIQRAWHCSIG